MMATTIYAVDQDVYLGHDDDEIICFRVSGAGDIPPSAFQIEHGFYGEWVAWYRLLDWYREEEAMAESPSTAKEAE